MTLYQLTDEYLQLLELAESEEIDPQTMQDTMEGLTGEIEDKAEGYVCVMKELEAQADKFEKEIARLTDRKATIDNNIRRLKESLLRTMEIIGKPKLATEHFKVSIAKNGGLQPMKITGDVPEEYIVMKPETDMKKIREALTNGAELPFAHLEDRGTHLSIR